MVPACSVASPLDREPPSSSLLSTQFQPDSSSCQPTTSTHGVSPPTAVAQVRRRERARRMMTSFLTLSRGSTPLRQPKLPPPRKQFQSIASPSALDAPTVISMWNPTSFATSTSITILLLTPPYNTPPSATSTSAPIVTAFTHKSTPGNIKRNSVPHKLQQLFPPSLVFQESTPTTHPRP